MCTLQEHKSSRIPEQGTRIQATGNSQMHRAVPCGGLGDAETEGIRTFASAAQILPIGIIGSRGVREISFRSAGRGRVPMGLSRIRECSSECVRKRRLVPAVVAEVAPRTGGREQAGTACASDEEYRKSTGNGSRALAGA